MGKFPTTAAIHFLRRNKVPFEAALYRYEGTGNVAKTAAAGIGAAEEEVFKTLVFKCEEDFVLVMLAADQTVSGAKLSTAHGAKKKGEPAQRADAERVTGYKVGGISPLGTRRPMPLYLDEGAQTFEKIWLNGGSHGFMIRIAVADLVRILDGTVVDLKQ
jgi:Cys-tRNA(Pro)/Cys-tRNA(Cys) deacylase